MLFAFLLLVSAAIGQTNNATTNGNNAFAFELFKKLYSNDANVFFSPYSIRSALAMTYAGAEKETKKQMSKVLHFDLNNTTTAQEFLDFDKKIKELNKDTTLKISIANALWKKDEPKYPFKKDYLELTKKYFDAAIYPLPPKAKPINDWVSNKTNGKIPTIITNQDITSLTRLILTNAIYFKGEWQEKFRKENTKKEVFHVTKDKSINVDMMHQGAFVDYFEDDNTQAIKLPYNNGSMVMTIVLPKENSSTEALSKDINNAFIANSRFSNNKVQIFIPKFTFSWGKELKEPLKSMGMRDAFDDDADFSGMTKRKILCIDKVIHKAFVSVNEEGTEAAAATAITMIMATSAMHKLENQIIFKADRPFLVLISEKNTGNILFMGTVINPNLK